MDDERLMLELARQQQLIEALIATQRSLLEQRDHLSDELCGQMERLWSDVSSSPTSVIPSSKKKRAAFEPACTDDIEVSGDIDEHVTYRCIGGTEVGMDQTIDPDTITYRSLSVSSADLGLDMADEFAADDPALPSTEPVGRSVSAEPDVPSEIASSLAQRVEILSKICAFLEQKESEWTDAAAAAGIMETALQLSQPLSQLVAC
uniref:Uncharacterized protein n=1 Tax=Haptolina ericina TaxID=156174 RepID=A0A7S3F9E3_9EUKA